ncbi:hypothetical protein J1N35_013955 [Gossypium stocksii]|uniref:Uncharacterized protein n=1 Tax=Gossypium stocksii TaxID=47602 RepID=A0A9D3VW31_9ROSI|nr:hypothetical protein J1N35_013955 [Gossypium stocksii]
MPQERANQNDHTMCGQRLDQIQGEMQSISTEVKQREGKENVNAVVLILGEVLSTPENQTQVENKEDNNGLQKEGIQNTNTETEPKEVAKPATEPKVEPNRELALAIACPCVQTMAK